MAKLAYFFRAIPRACKLACCNCCGFFGKVGNNSFCVFYVFGCLKPEVLKN